MLFTVFSRTLMNLLKDRDISMSSSEGLLVMSLLQEITSSYLVFCLVINYWSI